MGIVREMLRCRGPAFGMRKTVFPFDSHRTGEGSGNPVSRNRPGRVRAKSEYRAMGESIWVAFYFHPSQQAPTPANKFAGDPSAGRGPRLRKKPLECIGFGFHQL